MHHDHPEDTKDMYGMQSYSSSFEVSMAEALASYLIKNGYDQPGDIAILTPYLGQLSKLRDALKSSFMLVIDERDQEQLDQKEQDEGGDGSQGITHVQGGNTIGVKNVSLQKQLTLRTIDNYQVGIHLNYFFRAPLQRSTPSTNCFQIYTLDHIGRGSQDHYHFSRQEQRRQRLRRIWKDWFPQVTQSHECSVVSGATRNVHHWQRLANGERKERNLAQRH